MEIGGYLLREVFWIQGSLSAPEIFKDFPDAMPCHKYFLQLRHKHIAHDQNAYSQAFPARSLTDPQSPTRWRRMYRPHFMWRALTRTTTKPCSISCGELYTEEQIDLLCNQITEQLQKRIA
jgi:hypothetical protein